MALCLVILYLFYLCYGNVCYAVVVLYVPRFGCCLINCCGEEEKIHKLSQICKSDLEECKLVYWQLTSRLPTEVVL